MRAISYIRYGSLGVLGSVALLEHLDGWVPGHLKRSSKVTLGVGIEESKLKIVRIAFQGLEELWLDLCLLTYAFRSPI